MSGKENKSPLKYRNLDELKPHYDSLHLSGKNPRDLMQKLDLIFKKAHEKMASGDLEDAYILIMKYLNVFSFIQKSEDFRNDSKYYKAMLGRQPKQAMDLAENLHYNLRTTYNMLNLSENEKNKKEKSGLKNINVNIEMPDMRVKKESKSVVTSAKLFTMLRDDTTKVLIMDIRPESDFQSSRIKDSIVNIPGDLIVKGKSANMLEQQLSNASKDLWKLRGTYDQVILMDWMTNEQSFKDSTLAVLKEILTEWDVDTNYKNEILILDGGYEDWLDKYPWSTTNPKPLRPFVEETTSDIVLEQITYPDLDDLNANVEQEFLKPFFDRSKKPLKRSLNELDQDVSEEPSVQLDVSVRPSFDRAKKAAAIKTYDERKADVANLLNQKAKETSEALVLEQTMLDNEKELQETIRKQKEIQADEEQKRLLEEKEVKLLMKVEELKEESILKDSKIKELQKIIEIYEKRDVEEMARKEEDEERRIREAEMNERIKIQEEEKRRLAEEREEIEKTKLLERKILEEKYREKLEIARSKKKRLSENTFINSSHGVMVDDGSNRIPTINRSTKPRIEEKIRQFSGVKGNVGRGLTGLKNLGNTCYMNSIIQCISNNSALAKYFCGNHYREDLHRRNKTKGEVAEEVAAVIKTLWSGHFRSIACKDLKNTVGTYKAEYATFEQQDSHEFLTFLMDWLHSDLNKISSLNSSENENNLNEMEKAWLDFNQKNESLISTLFYGLQKSTLTCVKCDEASITYEPFSNLSLIIPDSEFSTIDQCLRLYLKSERISGWRCPKCKEFRDAEKKTDICKLPLILIIHLKRWRYFFAFHYVEVLSRKRTCYVDFPLNDLNMSQYVVSSKQRHVNYNLYAISNHYGTMEGGHYTAFCRSPLYKKWYKFDDHEVFEMSPSEVKTSAAYILFYTSINCPVPEPAS